MNIGPRQLQGAVTRDLDACQRAAVTELTTQILRGLTRPYPPSPGTPVDTGWHRSGWRVGSPKAPVDALPEGLGSYPIPGDNVPVEAMAGWRPGEQFEIASNTGVPELLDKGRSTQAPVGFVQQALDGAARRMVRWVYPGAAP